MKNIYSRTFFIATLIVVGTVSSLVWQKNNIKNNVPLNVGILPVNSATTSSDDIGTWKTYDNTAFYYNLKYPQNSIIAPIQEMETPTTTESSAIEIFTPGSSITGIRIIVWRKYLGNQNYEREAHNHLISLDLESFAKKLRQNDINDKNPNFLNKKISEVQTLEFAGERAYSFLITGSMDGYGHSSYYRVFTEHNGVKFEIQYPKDEPTSEQVIKTFNFVK